MQPSRTIKGAWRKAGRPQPLKKYARQLAEGDGPLATVARLWLRLKRAPEQQPERQPGSWQLRRNTMVLAGLPRCAGKFVTLDKIASRVDLRKRDIDDGLTALIRLGYVVRQGNEYARTQDSHSVAARGKAGA